jgi:hypothetical protein
MSGQQRYSGNEFDRALRELAEETAGRHPGPALNPYSLAAYVPAGCTRSTGT